MTQTDHHILVVALHGQGCVPFLDGTHEHSSLCCNYRVECLFPGPDCWPPWETPEPGACYVSTAPDMGDAAEATHQERPGVYIVAVRFDADSQSMHFDRRKQLKGISPPWPNQ